MKFREAIKAAKDFGKGTLLWNGIRGKKSEFEFLLYNEGTDRSEYWEQFHFQTDVDFREYSVDCTIGIDDFDWWGY